MSKKNIVLIDSSAEEGKDFIDGLKKSTGLDWELKVEKSNDRRTKTKEALRYVKYFLVPLKVFIFRKKYDKIIAWQQFYGTIFAVYCRFFHVKKTNTLIVMAFTYKEKKGIKGKLYKKLLNYAVTSKYIDRFTSVASVQPSRFSKEFNVPENKFIYIPWGITDFSKNLNYLKKDSLPYFFCAGRSNRNWDIVFETFGNSELPCKFIYSDKSYIGKYSNIEVSSNVSDEEYYDLSINAYCVIISIDNCKMAGGEITILNAMQFGKPVILIQDDPRNDYVFEGITGYVVPKKKDDILAVANMLMTDTVLRDRIAQNAREIYENQFSIYAVGQKVGELVSNE